MEKQFNLICERVYLLLAKRLALWINTKKLSGWIQDYDASKGIQEHADVLLDG